MKYFLPTSLALACACVTAAPSAEDTLPTISVTADFRAIEALKAANSVSVIEAETIARRDAKHLDQILNTAPNVNFAAGASRGRFVQIRGIGERSQFKDPLDASVGTVIDGIDYSGIGLAASLYDVKQVEVLRGPQGTRFGSSAMAGLISIQSNDASDENYSKLDLGVGNYGSRNAGLIFNGALNDQLVGRLSLHTNRSDGYINNPYLNRDDTNKIDENTIKAQLKWTASEDLSITLNAHHIDADNGYNAFSLDNSRNIPSDEPGHDRQRSSAASLKTEWTGNESFDLQGTVTVENSDLEYGFDWDWTNLPSSGTQGKENNKRKRKAANIDLRAISKPGSEFLGAEWVVGVYAAKRDVDLSYDDSWYDIWGGGPWISTFDSNNLTERAATYGELSWELANDLTLSSGLRLERIETDYRDSAGVALSNGENQWGGNLTLEYDGLDNTLLYATVSRGYKIGGVNGQALGDASIPPSIADFLKQRATFDSETLINYELGLKGSYFDDSLDLSVSAFYMDRQNMQAKAWVLIPPAKWKSYLDNVDKGHNAGVELEAQWQATGNVQLFASLGWLDTQLGKITVINVDNNQPQDQSGRDQAHAPAYQFNVGTSVQLMDNLSMTLEVDGKDSFYFSNSHNDRSRAYELVHMSFVYQLEGLSLSLWGRNLGNVDYQTRGFYFDNGAGNQAYHQLGAPRTFGISGSYTF